jgi:transposase-like protein
MRDFDLLQAGCRRAAEGAKFMSKVEHRRFTAEQKLENLREAEQPGVTVSAVCRRPRHSMVGEWRPTAVP